MPSSYSQRLRLNYQASGDNLNTWGQTLNQGVFQLLEDAMAKRVEFALSGAKTLATTNGAADEARCAFLDVTSGTGGAVTVPAVEKLYVVRNGAEGDVTITTGGGAVAAIKPAEVVSVVCDGANVRRVQGRDLDGGRLTGLGAPVSNSDAATKAYVDAQAFGGVDLPGQGPGTAGKVVRSDGVVATWETLSVGDIEGAAPSVAPTISGGMSLTGSMTTTPVAVSGLTIDWSHGEMQVAEMSSSGAIAFSGLVGGKGQVLVLRLTISSGATPTWPPEVDWDNGVVPTLPDGKSVVGFTTFDGGVTIEGYNLGEAFA